MTPDVTTTPEALLGRGLSEAYDFGRDESLEKAERILAAYPALRDAIALGVAWAAVEAVLPSGWAMKVVTYKAHQHMAAAWSGSDWSDGTGPTKEAALLALHAALTARSEGSSGTEGLAREVGSDRDR